MVKEWRRHSAETVVRQGSWPKGERCADVTPRQRALREREGRQAVL
jgi:hypothetical protein